MKTSEVVMLTPSQTSWPRHVNDRLETKAPSQLWAMGNQEILALHKVGLFCSVHCPSYTLGEADSAMRALRDQGAAIVSGFHSPIEKECLRILLGDQVPSVIGLARSLKTTRIPSSWRPPLQEGRLLLISPFDELPRSPTRKSSRQRNELIAAMSDEVLILHAELGGNIERLTRMIDRWRIPRR